MNDETTTVDDALNDAEFGLGFTGEKVEPAVKEKPELAETPRETVEPKPEYIQITAKDWADVRAAAAKTASYDSQLSKAFGTIGNLQKLVTTLQGQTPRGGKIEISPTAFAEMEKDFPELAQQTRKALEAALAGYTGTGTSEVDPAKIESMMASYASKREIEALEDAYPDWRDIVGAVNTASEQPNPDNAFRKWLGTKDATYQARINGSESAAVISRAIRLFQNETKAQAKPSATPRDTARADRIRGAVQPKGDNAGIASGKSDDDEFTAGFNSR